MENDKAKIAGVATLNEEKVSGLALLPLLLFVLVYLATGIIMSAMGVEEPFYQISPAVAVFIGIVFAFIIIRRPFDEQFTSFIKGCGEENIIIMLTIYLLAGAFSSVAGAMGGVDSVVNFALHYAPSQFLVAGVFIISSFISLSCGTSVGTVGAMAAIAATLADKGGISMPLMLGAMISGALFGDNLSVISDTTIAATRTQNCELRDKFRVNLLIALPAALIAIFLYGIFGGGDAASIDVSDLDYSLLKILPYIVVLVIAIIGVNVYKVLFIGIILSGIIGMAYGDLTLIGIVQAIYDGFSGMSEVFYTSFLIGGLAKMMSDAGGLNWIVKKSVKFIKGRKSAETVVALLAFTTNCAIANNTISIIITGPIAKKISTEYRLDPRRVASLSDIFCCVSDGLLPHGTFLVMAGGMAMAEGFTVSPVSILPCLWYLFLLGVFALISICVPYADRIIKKDPWNFEYDMPESKVNAIQGNN